MPAQSVRPVVYWYLTFRCNLTCKHCWVNSSPSTSTETDLSTEELLGVIPQLKEFNAGVILTGGEPMTRRDFPLLFEELCRNGIPTSVETNATMVGERIVEAARSAVEAGGRISFAVSLDGGTAETHDWMRGTGSFRNTINGIRRLTQAGLRVEVGCVVNRRNWDSLPQLVEVAQELEVEAVKFVLPSPVGRAEENFDDLAIPLEQVPVALRRIADALKRYKGRAQLKIPPAVIPPDMQVEFRHRLAMSGCAVDYITSCQFPLLGILPDGSITVCALTREHPGVYFGNIRVNRLAEVWRDQTLGLRRERYLRAELEGICGDCVFKKECRGSCRAHSFMEFGSFEGPYPLCAEMDKRGLFPDVYRLSYVQGRAANLEGTGTHG